MKTYKIKIKAFFSNPKAWQRLILLSLLTMFISHLSIRISGSGFDVFTLIFGGLILAFVIGWSSFNGEVDLFFLGRSFGVVITSFELYRMFYSYLYPEVLDVMGTATGDFKGFTIILGSGFYIQSLVGKTIVSMIRETEFKPSFNLPRFKKKETAMTTINTQGSE